MPLPPKDIQSPTTQGPTMVDEFKHVGDTLRHYSQLRFVLLPIFFAFIGGILTFIYSKDSRPDWVLNGAKTAGICGAFLFWYLELRIASTIDRLETRAEELQKGMDYEVFKIIGGSDNPIIKFRDWISKKIVNRLPAFLVMAVMYIVVLFFWIGLPLPNKPETIPGPDETAPIQKTIQQIDLKPLENKLEKIRACIMNLKPSSCNHTCASPVDTSTLVAELQQIHNAITKLTLNCPTIQPAPATDTTTHVIIELKSIQFLLSNLTHEVKANQSPPVRSDQKNKRAGLFFQLGTSETK